ncbi:hypothetical protein [Paraclostridium bifermentans]
MFKSICSIYSFDNIYRNYILYVNGNSNVTVYYDKEFIGRTFDYEII